MPDSQAEGSTPGRRPIAPQPTLWHFPELHDFEPGEDLAATGADLEPGTVLSAYVAGCFPMPLSRKRLGWFSPDPRGIIVPSKLQVSRSLRQSVKRFEVTINSAFDEVIAGCADPSRPMGWIDHRITQAYSRLHQMGWVHSVEVWDDEGLAGGLYGVAIGGLFAGESMFHRRRDASKVALVHLVDQVAHHPANLIDVQWLTPHLESLGAEACSRAKYFDLVQTALHSPNPPDWLR